MDTCDLYVKYPIGLIIFAKQIVSLVMKITNESMNLWRIPTVERTTISTIEYK